MTNSYCRVTRAWRLGGVLLLAAGLQACGALQAKTEPVRPVLEMPEPPPREVTPAPVDAVSSAPSPVIVPAAPAHTRAPRPAHAKPVPEKPDPAPPVSASVAPDPPAVRAVDNAAPGAALQTTADVGGAERRIRDVLARARRDLSQVDYRGLSNAGRTQYDSAQRFIAQADEAVKVQNLVFAEQLADKAAGLAAGLRRR